jgi:outer membrane protein assembly complex protein YaeT
MIGRAPAAVNHRRSSRIGGLAWLGVPLAVAAVDARAQECPLVLEHPPAAPAAVAAAPSTPAPQVRAIRFTGVELDASRLRGRMRTKEARFWRPAGSTAYSAAAWAEDHRRLCELYREEGHVTATVGPPEVVEAPSRGGPGEVSLVIPVREGPRYRVGSVDVAGVTPGDEAGSAAAMGLSPGGEYRHALVRAGLESLRRRAGRRGHATWSSLVTLSPRSAPEGAVVDVAVQVSEGPPWFVGRIGFRGARTTRDATLRRAVVLDEGALFDTAALEESVRRLESLGYVRLRAVTVTPGQGQAADVTFTVEERPAFRYGLSGGVNSPEGISLAAEAGEVNAFGRGERAFGSVQVGENVRAFELSLAVPYVFGSRWTAGLEARRHRLELDGVPEGGLPPHVRDEDSFALSAQRPLGSHSSLGLRYSLAEVGLASAAGPPPPGFGSRRDGRLALSIAYDGWDHGWMPRRGLRAFGQIRGWGGPLGGSADAGEARVRAFGFAPLGRRGALGLGAQAGAIRSGREPAELPFDERYLLGGEAQLRGFAARTVGPRDEAGTVVAGTRYLVLQAEAHADLTGGVRALAFADAGRAWAEGATGRVRLSAGLEIRFELPVLRVPLRVIGALNPEREPFHPRTALRIAVGPVP